MFKIAGDRVEEFKTPMLADTQYLRVMPCGYIQIFEKDRQRVFGADGSTKYDSEYPFAYGDNPPYRDENGNAVAGEYDSDTETGLYYVSSRYYDPEIGRFINADTTDVLTATPMALTDKNLFAYCDNNPVMRADNGGEFWHIVGGAVIGGLVGAVSSIVGQAVSGNGINWAEVGVSAASGALTGAITAACPGMGAVATGIVHGVVGAGTYAATELVNGRTPTLGGTLAAGITSGVLAGGAKAISNKIAKPKIPQNTGTPFKGVSQVGVDPNSLTLNPNFTPHPGKYASALARIKSGGMYGTVEVTRNGLVINGQHRTLIGRQLGIAVDVIIR